MVEKDLTRMGPGPERTRIVAGLRRLAQRDGQSDPVTIDAVERIVPRGAFAAAAASLPKQR